jgi:hypothetical protein
VHLQHASSSSITSFSFLELEDADNVLSSQTPHEYPLAA